MKGLSVDLSGLDACRRTMLSQAGQFGGIADKFSGGGGGSAIFGTLPVAGRLASLCEQIGTAGGTQFAAAERFLRGVERGLDNVRQAVTDSEQTNVNVIQAT